MIQKIQIFPANKKIFNGLVLFCKRIFKICNEIGVEPVAYGSLAYFFYTKDKNLIIKDFDFLIPEKSFKKIIKVLKKENIKYKYSPEWHTLEIFVKNLKIDLDSVDYWYKDFKKFERFELEGLTMKVVSLNELIEIYKKASQNAKNKKRAYYKKYNKLKKLNKKEKTNKITKNKSKKIIFSF